MACVVNEKWRLGTDGLEDYFLLCDVHHSRHEAQPILACKPGDLVLLVVVVLKGRRLDDHRLSIDPDGNVPALCADARLSRPESV